MDNKHLVQQTIAFYDNHAKEYADSIENFVNYNEMRIFISYFQHKHGLRILDVGCAAGRDSRALKKIGFEVVGIDISKGLLKQAKQRSLNIEFMEMNMRNLSFPNNTFNGIWASQSMLHLPSSKEVIQTLSEFARVLKRSGLLFIMVKKQTSGKYAVISDKLSNKDRFFQYFTMEELKEYIAKEGFEIHTSYQTDDPVREDVKLLNIFAKKL